MKAKIKQVIRLVFRIGGIVLIIFSINCRESGTKQPEENAKMQKIMEVQKKHQHEIMAVPGVVGVGIGAENGNLVLKVLVKKKTPALIEKIPTELDGFKVMLEEVGEIKAL